MILAEQARKITDANLTSVRKRQIFETNNMQMMILTRATLGKTNLVYTVYKNYLTMKEFAQLLKELKGKTLEEKGYRVSRINDPSQDFYIFNIEWEEIDILANVDQGIAVDETPVNVPS